jgi:hypothetical protein
MGNSGHQRGRANGAAEIGILAAGTLVIKTAGVGRVLSRKLIEGQIGTLEGAEKGLMGLKS